MAENWTSLLSEHHSFKAPFFCKIRFYAPSRFQKVTERIQSQNAAHIGYIGMRPGVESVEAPEENPMQVEPGTAAGHVRYLDERPRSHGLFSSSGERPDLRAIQKELANHKGVVWRVVLSLTEDDAMRLDMTSRKNWETVLRATVPQAAAAMGIGETNLRWVAAFHQEKGHPHVHLVIWEKVPQRRRGKLSEAERKEVRKIFQNEIYADERTRLLQEKTAMRDLIRDLSKRELVDTVELMRGIREMQYELDLEFASMGFSKPGIPPKLFTSEANKIASKLNEIRSIMPQKGRIAYQYMHPEVKRAVDETTKLLLKQPVFEDAVRRYQAAVVGMTRQYTHNEDQITAAVDRAMKDLEKRVSQLVLKSVVESGKDRFMRVNPEKAAALIEVVKTASAPPMSDMTDGKVYLRLSLENLTIALKAAGAQTDDIVSTLRSWNDRTGANLEPSIIEKVVHEAAQRYDRSNEWGRPVVCSKNDFRIMCATLNFNADYIWERNLPKSSPQLGQSNEQHYSDGAMSAARKLWSSVWNAIERERLRTIAQSELLKRQIEIQQQRAREKE